MSDESANRTLTHFLFESKCLLCVFVHEWVYVHVRKELKGELQKTNLAWDVERSAIAYDPRAPHTHS